jgi:hypothetical protein
MKRRGGKTIAINTILLIVAIWIVTTTTIQRIKTPKMTETELFLHIPKSVILQWD